MTNNNFDDEDDEDLSSWVITKPDKKLGTSQCLSCARYRGDRPKAGPCCQAYPQGIPEEVFENIIDHKKPYHGDHGLQFEKDEDGLGGTLELAFDPSKHPHNPAGDSHGGEWASGGGTAVLEEPSKKYIPPKADSSIRFNSMLANKGGDIDRDLVASVLGVQPNSKVDFRWLDDTNGVMVEIRNEKYTSIRMIYFDDDNKHIENIFFTVDKKYQGQGLGTKILYDQVQGAKAAGFEYIKTEAARSNDMNGYYTWPRLGFDAPVKDVELSDKNTFFATQNKWHNLSDVMKTQEGRDWWKVNGGSTNMTFDLNDKTATKILTAARRAKRPDAVAL